MTKSPRLLAAPANPRTRRFAVAVAIGCGASSCSTAPEDAQLDTTAHELNTARIAERDPLDMTGMVRLALRNGYKVGANPFAGGIISEAYDPDHPGQNLVSVPFGKAWQSSIRDASHRGSYNPTQAGFSKYCGKPATLRKASSSLDEARKRISIAPFAAATFHSHVDAFENETYCSDEFAEPPAGYTIAACPNRANQHDSDCIGGEKVADQWSDEVMTEFDYDGFYEDVSSLLPNEAAAAVRHVFNYTWKRPPAALYQWIGDSTQVRDDGSQVPTLDPTAFVDDLTTLIDHEQRPRPSGLDLSRMTRSYGIRFDARWFTHYYRGQRDRTLTSPLPLHDNAEDRRTLEPDDFPLIVIARTDAPDARAWGLFYPYRSYCNEMPIRGLDSSGAARYTEDRRTGFTLLVDQYEGAARVDDRYGFYLEQHQLNFHQLLLGMFGPDRVRDVFAGSPFADATHEQLLGEYFIITGTPNQILGAAKRLEARFDRASAWAERTGCE